MGVAVAPPAGFNSTMQLPKRQLNKITVLVEFVIYGGLRTPWVYRSSYALIVRFYRNQRVCLCTHTLVFSYRIGTAHWAPLFARPLPSATSKKPKAPTKERPVLPVMRSYPLFYEKISGGVTSPDIFFFSSP